MMCLPTRKNARRIMYGNVRKVYPTAQLDQDRLLCGRYAAVWYLPEEQRYILSYCRHIFTDKSPVVLRDYMAA